jgi:ribonuclease HI
MGVHFEHNPSLDICRPLDGALMERYNVKHATNQVAELLAVYMALDRLVRGDASRWILYSDSMYCINTCTRWIRQWKASGWKKARSDVPIKNKLIIQDIASLLDECQSRRITVIFKHVRAHATIPVDTPVTSDAYRVRVGNDTADALANRAARL